MDSKSFPDYNTGLKMDVSHKKKLSSAELEVRYGSNPKDKTKRVELSATLARKIKNAYNVDLSYKMQALAPEKVRCCLPILFILKDVSFNQRSFLNKYKIISMFLNPNLR